jgi:hypothetical protein
VGARNWKGSGGKEWWEGGERRKSEGEKWETRREERKRKVRKKEREKKRKEKRREILYTTHLCICIHIHVQSHITHPSSAPPRCYLAPSRV